METEAEEINGKMDGELCEREMPASVPLRTCADPSRKAEYMQAAAAVSTIVRMQLQPNRYSFRIAPIPPLFGCVIEGRLCARSTYEVSTDKSEKLEL